MFKKAGFFPWCYGLAIPYMRWTWGKFESATIPTFFHQVCTNLIQILSKDGNGRNDVLSAFKRGYFLVQKAHQRSLFSVFHCGLFVLRFI